jgi:hypothetical protein
MTTPSRKDWEQLCDSFYKRASHLNRINKGTSHWNIFWKNMAIYYNITRPYSINSVPDSPIFKKIYNHMLKAKLELE